MSFFAPAPAQGDSYFAAAARQMMGAGFPTDLPDVSGANGEGSGLQPFGYPSGARPASQQEAGVDPNVRANCITQCLRIAYGLRVATWDQCMAHCEGRSFWRHIQPFIVHPGFG
jgi:hypothetical protein